MENQRLWNRVKENLQLQLDPDTFDTTFKDVITVVKNVNGTIYVLCPNTFIQTKINKHYLSKITSILQQETKEQVRFKFVEPSEVIDQVDTAKVVPTSVINQSRLNPNYTFQTFVVGESNKIAFRVASQVSNPDQGTYVANPLYIFGGVGLGKTHLMHAIGNAILDNDFSKRVVFFCSFVRIYVCVNLYQSQDI